MSNILLSIVIMTPGNNPDLQKSLESVSKLRERVSSELVVVDTGCNEVDRELVERYATRVVPFTWCDDFSAARNSGLAACEGQWILIYDDDEWFEDTEAIEEFFLSGDYRDYEAAMYRQRNYYAYEKDAYQDTYKKRMARRTAETRYEGRVHEQLLPKVDRIAKIPSYVHHYGYVQENVEARNQRGQRNVRIMQDMMREKPEDIRLRIQMAQEYSFVDDYLRLKEICEESLQLLSEKTDYESYLYRGGFYCGMVYALEMLGQYQAVIKHANQFLETPCSKSTQATLHRWMAAAAYHIGNTDVGVNAVGRYRELMQEFHKDEEAFRKEDMLLTRDALAPAVEESVNHIEGLLKEGPILSVSILTPGNNPYLRKCFESIRQLSAKVPTELVVVDTGCNAEDRLLVEEYATKVVDFAWCDDFSAARNAGLECCHGKWFLYLDDDEYLVDDGALSTFLLSEDENVGYATFPLWNYRDVEMTSYQESSVTRLHRRRENTRFCYRIHEGIPIEPGMQGVWIESPVGHYGYIFATEEERRIHSERNIRLLEDALAKEEKGNLHLANQLVHEYQIIGDYKKQVETGKRYYDSAEDELQERAILACGWMAGLIGVQDYEEAVTRVEQLVSENAEYHSAVATIYAYGIIALYHLQQFENVIDSIKKYLPMYDLAKTEPDALAREFFARNGLDAGYYQLIMQMGVISALILRDDDALNQFAQLVPWQDAGLLLHEDLPRVLCEVIEGNAYSAETARFLEAVLGIEQVKNAVLHYRMDTIRADATT